MEIGYQDEGAYEGRMAMAVNSEVWQTPSYFRRAYIATATALVGGVAGIYAMNRVES
jgi:hypothetical protein